MAHFQPDPKEVRAWVERTCAEQGVPVGIDDMETLKIIAGIFADQRRENEEWELAVRQRSGAQRLPDQITTTICQ